MKFHFVPPDENFQHLHYYSENSKWELGLHQMIFGVRVSANPVGSMGYTFEYCAGPMAIDQMQILALVIQIMESFPESITERELSAIMPKWKRRPIMDDPCFQQLKDMAERAKPNTD